VTIFTGEIGGADGPILDVTLMVTIPRQQALLRNQMGVPAPVPARLLVDTGASHSSIDQRFVTLLDLRPVGQVQIHTPSTGPLPAVADEYDIAIRIQGANGHTHLIPIAPVFGCDHAGQGIDGLFGRDLLGQGLLVYNGSDNRYALTF